MDLEELLELLELDSPDDFSDFEHYADLVECEEDIDFHVFAELLSSVDGDTIYKLTNDYFDDILKGIPDTSIDIFTLLTTIRQVLINLAKAADDSAHDKVLFAQELYRFREWYSINSIVHCQKTDTFIVTDSTISEALTLCRMENLNGDRYTYDFTECLDYELDEYSISLSDISEKAFGTVIEAEDHPHSHALRPSHGHGSDDHDCDQDHDEDEAEGEDAYSKGLIDRDLPVIDGEYDDEVEFDENY